MRMRCGAAGLLLVPLIATSAQAYEGDGYYSAFGVGTNTCAKMTDDVVRWQVAREIYAAYIDGFLVAVNASLPGKGDFFLGSDQAARYKFVLQYCEANPLDPVITAIHKLVKHYKSDFGYQ